MTFGLIAINLFPVGESLNVDVSTLEPTEW